MSCRLEAYLGRTATKLQALRRGTVQARLYRRMRPGAIAIQAAWRCAAARRAFLLQKAAAIRVQAHWRGLVALRAYRAAKVGPSLRRGPCDAKLEAVYVNGLSFVLVSETCKPAC